MVSDWLGSFEAGGRGVRLLGSTEKLRIAIALGARMTNRFLRPATIARIATIPGLMLCAAAVSAEKVLVADELDRLAEEHDFTVRGLEQTEEVYGKADGEKLYPRLRRLLENFDHVIVQSPEGGVERVIVLGEKVPFAPPPGVVSTETPRPERAEGGDIVLQTERRGTQHVVRVSLEGAGGKKVPLELHVDTGADFLVLPRSVISTLGLKANDLKERDMQTANGKVTGRIGTLPVLWLGENRITDVEAAFIEDGKLGGTGLLGMSVLGRYKLTMDDAENRITLGAKDSAESPSEEPTGEVTEEVKEEVTEAAPEVKAAPSDPGDKTP